MSYTTTTPSSAQVVGFNNDKAMFIVQTASTPSNAHWTTDGAHDDTDVTDAGYPAVRAYDSLGSLVTKTTGVAGTSPKYYNFYWSSTRAITFDSLLILGHNFNSIDITSIHLEISDDKDFQAGGSYNTIEIAKYETGSDAIDNRLFFTNLNSNGSGGTYDSGGAARVYGDVQYARLKIVHSGNKDPQFGEIILGTRYQLQRNPDLPYDDLGEITEVAEAKALSGVVRRYVVYRGQALRSFLASISTAAEITVIENWWKDIEDGTKPFVYVENPNTAPRPYLMTMETTALVFPKVGPFERQLSFSMIEQPPFLGRED